MMSQSNAILLLCVVIGAQGAQVTPMEKVITLLKSLSAKVQAEGANEAAQYDKYACFCKVQADEKQYAIEKSGEKIADLSAQIKELDTATAELDSEISELTTHISDIEHEIDRKTAKRNKKHSEYLVQAKDNNEAVDACGAAIEALRNSKSSMKGAKLSGNFVQVQKATSRILQTAVAQQPLPGVAHGSLTLLSELNSAKGAPKFQYQSNDIIATIEDLQANFKDMKMQLDKEWFHTNAAIEAAKLGLSNEKKFAEKAKSIKEAIVESKNEEVNNARSDRESQTKDRHADMVFQDQLTTDCEEKAVLFDQRSKMRGDEIRVLAEATTELVNGAVKDSKEFWAVQVKAKAHTMVAGPTVKAVVKKAPIRPVSFLQVKNNEQDEVSRRHVAVEKVLSLLTAAAARTGSTALQSAADRAKYSEDHFVKVRGLIKDLLAKLQADATGEASTKSVCDTGMAKGTSDRDEAMARIEMANAKITTFTANQNTLEDDIATLSNDIADLKKGVLEGEELTAEDQAALERTENMSEDAIESVKLALSLLEQFYNKAGLLQTGKYVPPGADRDGNTLDDMAPKVFEKKYYAAQTESKGITGILQVVLNDFERVKKNTLAEEARVAAAWVALRDPLTGDIFLKQKEIKNKEVKISNTKSDIIDQQQALAEAQDLFESSKEVLEGLKAMCIQGEETWDERKKAREDEIDALKDAMGILENWKGL